jgi:hypothetical protein
MDASRKHSKIAFDAVLPCYSRVRWEYAGVYLLAGPALSDLSILSHLFLVRHLFHPRSRPAKLRWHRIPLKADDLYPLQHWGNSYNVRSEEKGGGVWVE